MGSEAMCPASHPSGMDVQCRQTQPELQRWRGSCQPLLLQYLPPAPEARDSSSGLTEEGLIGCKDNRCLCIRAAVFKAASPESYLRRASDCAHPTKQTPRANQRKGKEKTEAGGARCVPNSKCSSGTVVFWEYPVSLNPACLEAFLLILWHYRDQEARNYLCVFLNPREATWKKKLCVTLGTFGEPG